MRLTGDERRHLAEVLRSRVGDRVIICPNDGKDYIYEITAFDKTALAILDAIFGEKLILR